MSSNRIIFLCRRYCPGEAWTNRILAYARGLAELGQEVCIFYLISDKNRSTYQIDIPGVTIIDLWKNDGFIARRFRPISFLINLLMFRKYIKKGDKIFVYNAERLLLDTAFKTGTPVYAEITEHPYIYNNNGISGERSIDKKMIGLSRLSGLSVISNNLKKYFISIGINENQVSVVNMFVDCNRFQNVAKESCSPYIAYCGTVSYDKDGVNLLIQSFSIFHKSHPDYKLFIIGRGYSTTVLDELKALANSFNIGSHVIFTGQVHPNEMPKLLVNARMLALERPNNLQAQNGFPTKLGEYLATGNPVVVTRVGEIPNFIIDKENGILAEPDNIEDFAQKLSWVADNYDQALKIGKNGQSLAQTHFSYITQSKVLLDLMNK